MAKSRRILQIIFLIIFAALFLSARYPYQTTISSDIFLRFSPLPPLFYFIDNFTIPSWCWPALVILFLTIFLGRFFCGWICPLGTSLDLFNRLFKSPSNKISERWSKLRWLKFGILSFAILLAIFSIHIWGYLDPLAIFTRLTTKIFYPLLTFFTEGFLILLSKISFTQSVSYTLYNVYKTHLMPESQAFYQGIGGLLVLTLIIFGLERFSRRFWCRYICPAGALFGLFSQFRFYERLVSESCPVCNRCQIECKMNAIPGGRIHETNKVECIECFNCGEKCPPKAKSIKYRFNWKPYHSKIDFSRRQFINTSAAGVLTFGLFSLGIKDKTASAKNIRPPGSLPEEEFLDRCIRCLQCVRICSSNGRCLQAAGFEQSLLNLWTPVALMREGYCEYNCNLCGLICPTDAILPLPLKVKQQTPIGLAYFDKNLCIPFARNEDCLVCEEHCPTPDKAIKFDIKMAQLPDGTSRAVKYPYVVRELCIGCGICEHKCPLPAQPAVWVIRENEKRFTRLEDAVQISP
jgi:polyferredoxin